MPLPRDTKNWFKFRLMTLPTKCSTTPGVPIYLLPKGYRNTVNKLMKMIAAFH